MAVISSHILNSADGSHASGVQVRLTAVETGESLFDTQTDGGGRLKVELSDIEPEADYELNFGVGAYWTERGIPSRLGEIALRFRMPDPTATYHSPIIISPNGYSGWISA